MTPRRTHTSTRSRRAGRAVAAWALVVLAGGALPSAGLCGASPAQPVPATPAPDRADEVGALNDRASALAGQRRHAEALALFDRAIELQRAREPQGRTMALLLSNSAQSLRELGRLDESLARLDAAEAIYAAAKPFTMGFSSAEKAAHERGATLYRMGGTLAARQRHHDAVRALTEALRLFRDVPGAMVEQADCLTAIGRSQASADPELREVAVLSLEEAVGLYERAGVNTPTYAQALASLGELLRDLKRLPEAAVRLLDAVRADWRFATEALPVMTEDQRQFLQLAVGASADPLYALAFSAGSGEAAPGLEGALLAKGMLHESALLERRALLAGATEQVRALWREQAELRSRLAAMALEPALQPLSLSPDDGTTRQQQMQALRDRIAEVDGRLRQDDVAGPALRSARLEPVPAARLAGALRAGQALLEYVRYRPGAGAPGSDRYGVFVVRAGKGPVAIDLGPAEPIDRAVAAYRAQLEQDIRRFSGVAPSNPQVRRAEKALADLGAALRALILDPALPAAGDATRWYISPDDTIGLVPFEALPVEHAEGAVTYQVESRRFVYLATSRDLLRAGPDAPAAGGRALLVGNPSFGASTRARAAAAAGLPPPADDAPPAAGGAGGEGERTMGSGPGERSVEVPEFSPLPDTGRFLETIRPWLEQRGVAVETRTGEAATEEAAQGAAGARLVQFATHGYFTGGTGELRAAGAGVSGYVRSML
ncbi:MAG: CHAT domain-containing protein, partial [Phycisphaerae bacterium]|nr:CHAT domain-containing protein [Phycisphaerae bacterium]